MSESEFYTVNSGYKAPGEVPDWPVWELRGHGSAAPAPEPAAPDDSAGNLGPGASPRRLDPLGPWFSARLTFDDGARIDVLVTVSEDGRITVEDMRADPPLTLDGLSALARWIEGPLDDACRVATGRPRKDQPSPGQEPAAEGGADPAAWPEQGPVAAAGLDTGPVSGPVSGTEPQSEPLSMAAPGLVPEAEWTADPKAFADSGTSAGTPTGTGTEAPADTGADDEPAAVHTREAAARTGEEEGTTEPSADGGVPSPDGPVVKGDGLLCRAPTALVEPPVDSPATLVEPPFVDPPLDPLVDPPSEPEPEPSPEHNSAGHPEHAADPSAAEARPEDVAPSPEGSASSPSAVLTRSRAGERRKFAADVYREAQREGRDPVLAVMNATGRNRRRSLRLIAGARDDGLLTPRHNKR
ncbi:hypothetical protein FCH28_00885 [Streptomyces piniterrae]|uniref:Uncharacterized protein n=1 Tax=Streptomyces piniterrae TaxID=2571125 RepID=A0A4U0NVM2_9ACTN|nr:hypothetical protein FCH28_00885 [Streptomyces piniterrae]